MENQPPRTGDSGHTTHRLGISHMPRTIVARALRAARLATVLMTTALTGYGVCAAPAAIRADDTATWPLIVTADRAEDCAQILTAAQHADNIAGLGTTFSLLN